MQDSLILHYCDRNLAKDRQQGHRSLDWHRYKLPTQADAGIFLHTSREHPPRHHVHIEEYSF